MKMYPKTGQTDRQTDTHQTDAICYNAARATTQSASTKPESSLSRLVENMQTRTDEQDVFISVRQIFAALFIATFAT